MQAASFVGMSRNGVTLFNDINLFTTLLVKSFVLSKPSPTHSISLEIVYQSTLIPYNCDKLLTLLRLLSTVDNEIFLNMIEKPEIKQHSWRYVEIW